jgi:hypothetical protein
MPVRIKVGFDSIATKKTLNVLGVIFDFKLQWTEQVAKAILKSNQSLNPLKMICKYFNMKELIKLVTSHHFSILLYNSEVWQLPDLKENLKYAIFEAYAKALKLCYHYCDPLTSYYEQLKLTNRAKPAMYSN